MTFEGLFQEVSDFDSDMFRNVAGMRRSQDLLDDLAADPRERAFGEAAAEREPELPEGLSPLITRPFVYGRALGAGACRISASRFSDGTDYGVWYGCLEFDTTVYETVHHWLRLLQEMHMEYKSEIVAERRVCLIHVSGLLVDLRRKHLEFPGLVDPENYAFTHQAGRYLYERRQNGLLVKSARCEGFNGAIFTPRVLSNPRHHCYLTYRWKAGRPTVRVERIPGRRLVEICTHQ